jgi:hypothetical protein
MSDSSVDQVGRPEARFEIKEYRFPEPAGGMQARGDVAQLASELGANYRAYHEHAAEALETFGGRPDPSDYADDYPGYALACRRVMDILVAEQALRQDLNPASGSRRGWLTTGTGFCPSRVARNVVWHGTAARQLPDGDRSNRRFIPNVRNLSGRRVFGKR